MKAYACVYRHPDPPRRDRLRTEQKAERNAMLRKYLNAYDREDCWYDWGDDPSFFVATEVLGSPNRATWGVCRRDVRASLAVGDFVVFFCGRQAGRGHWEYYYVGVGTVGARLSRELIWTDDRYLDYRGFFNILARPVNGVLAQKETIHEFHDDWANRCTAPYVVFDPDRSRFNLTDPVHVASYIRDRDSVEAWRTGDDRVVRIEKLVLPDPPRTRGLRSVNLQVAHPKMNLDSQARRAGGHEKLREELIMLVFG